MQPWRRCTGCQRPRKRRGGGVLRKAERQQHAYTHTTLWWYARSRWWHVVELVVAITQRAKSKLYPSRVSDDNRATNTGISVARYWQMLVSQMGNKLHRWSECTPKEKSSGCKSALVVVVEDFFFPLWRSVWREGSQSSKN